MWINTYFKDFAAHGVCWIGWLGKGGEMRLGYLFVNSGLEGAWLGVGKGPITLLCFTLHFIM